MKDSQKSKKRNYKKAIIDLPDQKIWKELDELVIESSHEKEPTMQCEKLKKIEGLLDKAFEMLLKKLIRQS